MEKITVYNLILQHKTSGNKYTTFFKYPLKCNLKKINESHDGDLQDRICLKNYEIIGHEKDSETLVYKIKWESTNLKRKLNYESQENKKKKMQDEDKELSTKKMNSLADVMEFVELSYSKLQWTEGDMNLENSSYQDAMDIGEKKAEIELLFDLGKRLGLKLKTPPNFDEKDGVEWSGKKNRQ